MDAHSRGEVAQKEGSYREPGRERGGQGQRGPNRREDERERAERVLKYDPQGFYGGKY